MIKKILIESVISSLVSSNFQKVLEYLNSKVFFTTTLNQENLYFNYIVNWLETERINKLRNIHLETRMSKDGVELVETYGPGYYWVRLHGKHMFIELSSATDKEKDKQKNKNKPTDKFEKIKIWFLSIEPKKDMEEFFQEMFLFAEKNKTNQDNIVKVYRNTTWGYWNTVGEINARPFSSLIFEQKIINDLMKDLEHFFVRKDWYFKLNIPYQRGYLLYGPPGNGKTSLIEAVAGYYNKNIYFFEYNINMDDSDLTALFERIPHQNSIIVIEDIDSLLEKRHLAYLKKEKKDESSPTVAEEDCFDFGRPALGLSGFLNCMDGLLSPDGRIIFVTTNKIEALDLAVLRPGRLDYKILIDNANKTQVKELLLRFFPDLPDKTVKKFVSKVGDGQVSMAELQEHFVRCYENIDNILNVPEEWSVNGI